MSALLSTLQIFIQDKIFRQELDVNDRDFNLRMTGYVLFATEAYYKMTVASFEPSDPHNMHLKFAGLASSMQGIGLVAQNDHIYFRESFSFALCDATIPYLLSLLSHDLTEALLDSKDFLLMEAFDICTQTRALYADCKPLVSGNVQIAEFDYSLFYPYVENLLQDTQRTSAEAIFNMTLEKIDHLSSDSHFAGCSVLLPDTLKTLEHVSFFFSSFSFFLSFP